MHNWFVATLSVSTTALLIFAYTAVAGTKICNDPIDLREAWDRAYCSGWSDRNLSVNTQIETLEVQVGKLDTMRAAITPLNCQKKISFPQASK